MSQPSPQTRFSSSLTAMLPRWWFAKESITLIARDGQASMIASSEPLDPSIDTHEYAEVQGELVRREFPGYQEYGFRPVTMFDGRTGYERQFSWTPPDGVEIVQVQRYYAESGRGYTATATAPSRQFERFRSVFDRVFESLSRDGSTPGGPASAATGALGAGHEVLVAGLEQAGFGYQVIDDAVLLTAFPLDAARTGRDELLVIVQWLGERRDVLSATAQITHPHPPFERWWDLVGAANQWNTERSWPVAVVSRREDAPDQAEVTLRTRAMLPDGVSAHHVGSIVHDIAASGTEFWERIRGGFGI